MKRRRQLFAWIFFASYAAFAAVSFIVDFSFGMRSVSNFVLFSREMVFILPAAFVLIGLFEVWVPREVVERHLGKTSGFQGYLWALLLSGTTVGGLYVSFPVAWALRKKGASLGVVFAYIGLSGVCRVPMTLFEISFLGAEFTVLRYLVSVPLTVLVSDQLGKYLENRQYGLQDPDT